MMSEFPLHILFQNGERARVRSGQDLRVEYVAASHPDPLPVKYGEREKGKRRTCT
jgi:hypothetical protein